MRYSLILLAAGQGKRMKAGKNKLLIELQNRPLLLHTLTLFEEDPWCDEVVLVAHQGEIELLADLIDGDYGKIKKIIPGGVERQDSVKCGLDEIDAGKIVLIHDGARPFVKRTVIHELVEVAAEDGAAIVAVPVKDTIKKVENQQVVDTLDRSELWSVQTPQAFQVGLIKQAHNKALIEQKLGTDDASLVEWYGKPVTIVEGDYFNIKITTQEDLLFAEAIIGMEARNNDV
ncbi:2-C-methyl-D-erythritol 4-phosphate cytidylyltransferase [Alkalihalobacillus alcalophilus ATCC 27647 = CGMCC 1.3604]|uniref:2-C-methyl-D-erythritol 4-phosphate cytidylyltransferase n=1 Tax=Alkalihalobacillus alcalophilus ATCC 27647 = CGMCC 1.3604 TaxID=1218173 RepID=A0A094WND1_ALKAL|nr:2-C-methyl-D-erythritol 4-phosphate cytidylyltransferase [Alkalihalobacillus alcalophilus]KGA98341.1 2-C-methyl-D-erythritol 4-phosphate cytidylyltransferase [Alkalihalobacillus alcalophilus ATCC 27647 = CGMCC 1.3604]MED1561659.1 2-C-methyl-D-erythritol 4-phosphate cytidylyltransferase [Alkalihalobacillus alcalophilus]THG89937.1 2-C-methyl-D-erythritol 4-phosphate cytidylyltransferase [Alkalihalobacillus alcalophilus ATCC 27647 = CGMCC 1.3604]